MSNFRYLNRNKSYHVPNLPILGDGYTPKQFSNSLGCLQAVTVKAPRKIIDVGTMIDGQDPNTSGCSQNITNQKDTK